MALDRVVAPASSIMTLDELREYVRASGDDDTTLTALLASATEWMDGWSGVLGMAMMPQTWELTLDRFPAGAICLPLGPAVSIASVKYTDADGAEQTIDSGEYALDGQNLTADAWPRGSAVRVRYVAGKGAPYRAIQAAKMLVAHWYDTRNAAGDPQQETPMAVNMLIGNIRRNRL